MRMKLMECMTYSITVLRNFCQFALPPSILAVDISTASALLPPQESFSSTKRRLHDRPFS